MPETNRQLSFTPRHHALLFSSIAKAVLDEVGKVQGEKYIRKAVAVYGQQRGRRMALRAQHNGHPLSMANYFAYGEWEAPKGEMNLVFKEKVPDARVHISKCPWHSVWKEKDLLDYGRYFCMEIDTALVNGFNPDLVINIHATRTNGGECCDFVFKDANLSFFALLSLAFKKKFTPGKSAIMPWEYHVGHLFKTLGEVFADT
ncbi:MAG: L-2-amino-thiazoline-4-carboxylic acid hydrolase, partial [Desulfobacteraceae bacterium]|nr:L-2-amino-thiazoline-4-carboxylic acid hydrolase [Desulfobacteraceae bacterium]